MSEFKCGECFSAYLHHSSSCSQRDIPASVQVDALITEAIRADREKLAGLVEEMEYRSASCDLVCYCPSGMARALGQKDAIEIIRTTPIAELNNE